MIFLFKKGDFQVHHVTLPKTNSSPLKISRVQRRKRPRIPTIHFQVLLLLVSGRVIHSQMFLSSMFCKLKPSQPPSLVLVSYSSIPSLFSVWIVMLTTDECEGLWGHKNRPKPGKRKTPIGFVEIIPLFLVSLMYVKMVPPFYQLDMLTFGVEGIQVPGCENVMK